MIAVEGHFAYSFLTGIFAAVNPCGFVLLPAYLMYFLGLDSAAPRSQRAGVQRALLVSAATSAGFMTVFIIVATISRVFTYAIQDNAKYLSLVIGIALIVMACFMFTGWKPPFASPQIGSGAERKKTFASMFGFGVAYAVASIGCTIGFLVSAIFGSFSANGFVSGVISVALYGVGMSLLVTALTVALAFANGGFVRVLRRGLKFIDRIAAVFILLTGIYLTRYWYQAIRNRPAGSRVEDWQGEIVTFLQGQGAGKLAVVFGGLVLAAVAFVILGGRGRDRTRAPE